MRLAMCVGLLFVVGCSGGSSSSGFDPNDLIATLQWLDGFDKEISTATESKNNLKIREVRKRVIEEVSKEVQPFIGQEVVWEFPVSKVGYEVEGRSMIMLEEIKDFKYFLFPGDVPSSIQEDLEDLTLADVSVTYWVMEKIEIGSVITKEHAAKLEAGDKIKIKGKLASLKFGDYSGQCIALTNVKVVE